MQKIYESQLHGWDESAERVYVYTLDNDEEYFELCALNHKEMCDKFDVFDEFILFPKTIINSILQVFDQAAIFYRFYLIL